MVKAWVRHKTTETVLNIVGGWWWLAVGAWWRLAIGGGWRLAAVGGWWSLGLSFRSVLHRKKMGFLRTALVCTEGGGGAASH